MAAITDLREAESKEQQEERVAQERREDGIEDAGPAAAEPEGVAVGEGGEEDAEGEGDGEEGLPPLQLEGLGTGQLSLRIGGPRPDVATAKLVGGKIQLPSGEFQPGDIIDATIRLRCTKAAIIDKVNNSTGDVSEREREHTFRMLAIERVS